MDFDRLRDAMVRDQLEARGIADARVLAAMRKVPRERFVPRDLQRYAYDDRALRIECEQTISQPYIVALMAEAASIAPGARVLEVGAGSGYAAAVLGEMAAEIFTVERHPELARLAAGRLSALGYDHVRVVEGDGTTGLPDHAPFQAILTPAAAADPPQALIDQLAPGGRLVMPVGSGGYQRLTRITRETGAELRAETLGDVAFVPLIAGPSPL